MKHKRKVTIVKVVYAVNTIYFLFARERMVLIITLFDREKIFHLVLPEKITGRYILTTEDKTGNKVDLMAVEAENGAWFIKSNQYAYLKGPQNEKQYKVKMDPFQTYTVHRQEDSTALLYVEPLSAGRNEFTKHIVTTNLVQIGRAKNSHICFDNRLVSSAHCQIEYAANGKAKIRDQQSSNGTYVNGERVTEKALKVGDVISIMGLRVIYNGKMLALNNPHHAVLLDRNVFQPFVGEKPVVQEEEELDDFLIKEENPDLFYRSPRFKRDIERKTIKIDPPPSQGNLEETPLMLMLGPSITMGMASLFAGLFAVQNVMRNNGDIMYAMPTLMMSISMLIGMVLWPILTKRYEKKKRIANEKKRQEKYRAYLVEMKQVIEDECEHQRTILHENHISLHNCLKRIHQRDRTLWERGIGQNDFLKLRVGIGDLPLDAEIKFQEKKFTLEDDDLQEALYQLVETPPVLKQVPVTVSLIEEQVSGIIGNRKEVADFAKGIMFQLAALHSYDELKFVFLYDKHEQEIWQFAKWLPHVWNEDKSVRFIATDANEVKELSAYFEKEIAFRQELDDPEEITQHYVVFSMSKDLAAKAEMINMLLKEKNQIGFSLVTMYDSLEMLPKECSNVIELGTDISKIYDKDDISGKYQAFHADIYMREDAEEVARKLANIQLASSVEAYTLPDMLTFLEMFHVGKVEHLNAPTRWKENNPTLSIQTQIGVNQMGEPFMIDLHEKFHGPHGLIAGMTGSGKSEFIMTFILSLAVNYHPDEVAFILIDYKGGGMANAFLELPHLAGTITNLDGAAVKRSLISIQSELKRRQAIFSETSRRLGESNIDIYKYQKLYREGVVTEPLQHLFMISDEFAELKTQQPEFMDQLVSAARIGRSLGVHLILATQKPSGVVDDQIWSNSKFRISLKVQEKADSMEVIKRPDAAELKQTGRFYLQVGYNELFELGQSAWAGAPYYPTDKVEKREDDGIVVIDHLGRVQKSARIDKHKNMMKNPAKQIDEVTKYLAALADQENISVKPLWLEPIPAFIYVDKLKAKYAGEQREQFELRPLIGEYDDPANQRQLPLHLPITAEGNTVVYGVAGSGKTTFLMTMIHSLMEEHTPEEVNLYLLDFGAETLNWYKEAPHVGDVLLSHDAEKIDHLFKMMQKEIAMRKKKFSAYGGDFTTYNRVASEPVPAWVIVIHNYAAFSEMFDRYEETVSFLTREGTKYGIYFVVTALNTGDIRYRLLQNFKQLYVLQLNDQSEYSGVLGNVDGVYPSKFKGRGIFKTDDVYEFQIANISKQATDRYRFITEYSRTKRQDWNRGGAKRIPILPEQVDLNYLQEDAAFKTSIRVPMGVEKETLATHYHDFYDEFVHLVTATTAEDCAPFMQGLAEVLSAKANGEVIVLDAEENFVFDEQRGYHYVTGANLLEAKVVELFNTLVYRNNTTKEAEEAGEKPPEFEQVTYLIPSFTALNSELSADGQDKVKVFLEHGDKLNVTIVLADAVDKWNSFTFEPWFQKQASLSDAIWIGNGITDQYTLKITKITNDMYGELPDGFGYIIQKGKVKKVKLLTTVMQEEEAVQYA
ncbi:type VII secretion protein EssC [Mesobacillus maritimus]|uniref:type VII secretion protein EssC n=1 Tax=Mesobacillus maritimus TaxID=1643336 RepID=UPI00203D7745|nr:type VII secretion protein EssC [Mesobacillus maritimus]MCM3585273.1 type VII secretion protein EssC [Mesobacillus maritimus]